MSSEKNISKNDEFEPKGVEIPPYNETSSNTHKLTGHERDSSTGYDYMHARYYGSSIGRFMRPDPINGTPASPQSWNLYAYVQNNPVNATDPTGMFTLTPSTIKNLLAMFGGFSGMESEVYIKNETITGGGGTSKNSNDVHLNVPVYYDAAMGMTSDKRIQDFNELLTEISETQKVYKEMGIELDFFYNGTIEFKIYNEKNNTKNLKIYTEKGKEFSLGSLFMVRTNDLRLCGNSGAQFFQFEESGTAMIAVRNAISTNTYIEEFAHAFGIGRHLWWDTPMPFMGFITVPLIRYMHYGAEDMKKFALQYSNP